jgi:alcohol dehydrogenase (cytochrome c)
MTSNPPYYRIYLLTAWQERTRGPPEQITWRFRLEDPRTGRQVWSFKQYDVTDSGILTTATDVLFTGGREGYFHALNARTGALLWKASLGGQIVNGPISYEVDGKQYVATISGNNLVVFALRD